MLKIMKKLIELVKYKKLFYANSKEDHLYQEVLCFLKRHSSYIVWNCVEIPRNDILAKIVKVIIKIRIGDVDK